MKNRQFDLVTSDGLDLRGHKKPRTIRYVTAPNHVEYEFRYATGPNHVDSWAYVYAFTLGISRGRKAAAGACMEMYNILYFI